jgi:triphosphatase
MRWLINGLGEARDLDVFIDEVIAAVITDRPNDKDLKAVLRTAKKMRTAAYRRVRKRFRRAAIQLRCLELSLWIEKRAWRNTVTQQKLDSPIKNVAPKLLAKRHRKVLAVGEKL